MCATAYRAWAISRTVTATYLKSQPYQTQFGPLNHPTLLACDYLVHAQARVALPVPLAAPIALSWPVLPHENLLSTELLNYSGPNGSIGYVWLPNGDLVAIRNKQHVI